MDPRLITTRDDLHRRLPGSLLLRQLAARWARDLPAYAYDGAVGLFHDFGPDPELVVVGDRAAAVSLARAVRDRHPEITGRVSVPAAAAARLVAEDRLAEVVTWAFRWTAVPPSRPAATEIAWLPDAAAGEVSAVLASGFPDASMPVGHPDVRRWAGLRRAGRLVAVAADTTVAPGVGFLASIATHPDARGTGAGAAVTAWATARLVAEQGACALWHMGDNAVASALYTRLGFRDDDRMAVVGPP